MTLPIPSQQPSKVTMSELHTNWRKSVPRSDRIHVCHHIFSKLRSYFPDIPENALKQKTSRVESQAYIGALSRRDYLDQVAEILSKAESRKRRTSPPQLSPYKRTRFTPPLSPKQPLSWRASVSREDRVNACHYIVRNVEAMRLNLPHAVVIHMVSTFERQSFLKANSRRDYVQRISKGLSKLRSHPILREQVARDNVPDVTAQNCAPSCATNVSGASNMSSTSRTSSPQVAAPSVPCDVGGVMDWRLALTRGERTERCRRILHDLRVCYTDLDDDALKEKTRAFEEQAFGRATNQVEYDEAITAGLVMLRKQMGGCVEEAGLRKIEREGVGSGQGSNGGGDDTIVVNGIGKRSWRKEMAREERVRNCQKMLIKLSVYYPGLDERLIKEKVSVFESCAFAHATGKEDYHAKIEEGLEKVEERMLGKVKGKENREGSREVQNSNAEEEAEASEGAVEESGCELEESGEVAGDSEGMFNESDPVGEGYGMLQENRDVEEELEEMRRNLEGDRDGEGAEKECEVREDEDFGDWFESEDAFALESDMSLFREDGPFLMDAGL